jgi:streptogramin lyase
MLEGRVGANVLSRRRGRCVLVGFVLAVAALCAYASAAIAAKYSIPTPELVAANTEGSVNGVASDGGGGVWFNDWEWPPGGGKEKVYMAHYIPGLPLQRVDTNIELDQGQIGQIFGIAPGLNGDEWFSRPSEFAVSRIAPDGSVTTFPLPDRSYPGDLVVDRFGNVWIVITGGETSGKTIKLAPDGEMSIWPSGGGSNTGVTIGPDGNLWWAGFTGGVSDISTSDPTQSPKVYPLTFEAGDESDDGIASLGGRVWATVGAYGYRIDAFALDGSIQRYKLKTLNPGAIVAGPDAAVWFTGYVRKTGKPVIGRLSETGQLSIRELSTGIAGIGASNDAVYITENKVGLLRIPVTPVAPVSMAALGDSYSSGEGNAPYEQGSDAHTDPPDACHRSVAAYGALVASALGDSLTFVACSGAVTNDLFAPNAKNITEPAQVSALNDQTHVVTVTIGGNDGGFPLLLEQCVDLTPWHSGFGCSANTSLANVTDTRLSALAGTNDATTPTGAPIHSILNVIRAIHKAAPNAHIYFGLYPELFGAGKSRYAVDVLAPSGRACKVGSFLGEELMVDYSDATWLDGLGKELDPFEGGRCGWCGTDLSDGGEAGEVQGARLLRL